MKPAAVMLVCSLALNALLVAGFARRRLSSGAGDGGTNAPTVSWPGAASRAASGEKTAATAQSLLALEPAAMRAALLRMNLPREAVDALVTARIYAQHDARREAFVRETARLPWWKTAAVSLGAMSLFTADQRKELRDLDAVARNEVLRVLGPESLDRDGAIAARFNFVDPERAVRLESMLRDYEHLGSMLREEMRGLRTRADRANEAFLESERQRDLAKLLTPEERDFFELRASPAAVSMRFRLATFEPTEQEYRALFSIFREFHEKHPGSVTVEGNARPSYFPEYSDYDDRIRATLGERRYADWVLAGHGYTQTLVRIAPELGLGSATVKGAAMLLRDTAARSWMIGEDNATTIEEKLTALKVLAATTRSELVTMLGATGSAALLRETPWLDTIASGHSVKVDGSRTSWLPAGLVSRAAREPPRPPTLPDLGVPTPTPTPDR